MHPVQKVQIAQWPKVKALWYVLKVSSQAMFFKNFHGVKLASFC
jgi:hypothetical protein